MPRLDYKRCKACGKSSADVGTLSHTRLCASCGADRFTRNAMAISTHSGPEFLRWRRANAAAYGAVLLDDLEALVQGGDHAA